jgi:hypothetical protein
MMTSLIAVWYSALIEAIVVPPFLLEFCERLRRAYTDAIATAHRPALLQIPIAHRLY